MKGHIGCTLLTWARDWTCNPRTHLWPGIEPETLCAGRCLTITTPARAPHCYYMHLTLWNIWIINPSRINYSNWSREVSLRVRVRATSCSVCCSYQSPSTALDKQPVSEHHLRLTCPMTNCPFPLPLVLVSYFCFIQHIARLQGRDLHQFSSCSLPIPFFP